MREKIQITVNEKGEHFIQATFNIGKVASASSPDASYVTLSMGVEAVMQVLSYTLKNFDRETPGWETRFDEALNEYCKQWMLGRLGIFQHPLQYNEEGNIEGLKREYEVTTCKYE